MTKHELADRLHHLDPGATMTVEPSLLEAIFGGTLSQEVIQAIETFALEHRCTFVHHEHRSALPTFEKDDIF